MKSSIVVSQILPGARCATWSGDRIKNSGNLSLEEQVDFVKNLSIPYIQVLEYTNIPSFYIYAEPQATAKSHIDDRITISKFTWAVTMLVGMAEDPYWSLATVKNVVSSAFSPSDETDGQSNKYHAKMVVEGIDEKNNYFMHFSHFTTHGVKERILYHDVSYESRTDVYKSDARKVQKMINVIIAEVPLRKKLELSKLGRSSRILNRKGNDSCVTWAKEKMKIADIDLGDSIFEWFATVSTNYTKKNEVYKSLLSYSSCKIAGTDEEKISFFPTNELV